MTDSAQTDTVLENTLDRLFEKACGSEARQAAEAEGWIAELWGTLAAAGMPWLGVPRSAGGPGGGLSDASCLLRMAGLHAVPLPLAEPSGLLGGWIVARAGLQLPDGPLSVPLPHRGDRLHYSGGQVRGCLHRVPWGSRVSTVAALATSDEGPRVVLLDPSRATCAPGRNVAGEPRDKLTFVEVAVGSEQVAFASSDIPEELFLRGALSRTLLMAGALEAVAELTVSYSAQRHQFGRPIGRFQAVAQRLARLASETEAAALAAGVAVRRFEVAGIEATFEVAAAKTTVARAATQVAVDAHQIHGAIGMSREYPLHHFTRRLWAWRQEWGSEAHWATVLGRQTMTSGAQALWPRLTLGLRDGAGPVLPGSAPTALMEVR
jgi:acyl-CoA dehydrogenase